MDILIGKDRTGRSDYNASIRQHTSAYVSIRILLERIGRVVQTAAGHMSADVSIRMHMPADVSIRMHMSADVSIHMHVPADVSIRMHMSADVSIRMHMSADVSIRIRGRVVHTAAGHADADVC